MSDLGLLTVIAPLVIILGIITITIVVCIRCCRRNQTAGYVTTHVTQQPPAQGTRFFTNPIPGTPQSQYQPHMYPTQQYPNQYAPAVNTYGGQQPYQPGVQAGMMQHAGNSGNPVMQPSPQPPFNPAWSPSPNGQQSGSDLPPPYEAICNPNAPKPHDFK